jgi:short-subunit dehydrogenase
MQTFHGRNIWIIGASSGIGEALAYKIASLGGRCILSSRNIEKLNAIKQQLGAKHEVLAFDVTNYDDVKKSVEQAKSYGNLDCILYMSAYYERLMLEELGGEVTENIVKTNLIGALNFVGCITPILKQQNKGQFALCASVAAYRGLPKAQPYSATKAAILNLAESMKCDFLDSNIDIKVINPGFVKTPLTDKNPFDMPHIITPQEAADYIIDGLAKTGFEIHFPPKFSYKLKFLRLAPHWLYFYLVKKFL